MAFCVENFIQINHCYLKTTGFIFEELEHVNEKRFALKMTYNCFTIVKSLIYTKISGLSLKKQTSNEAQQLTM